MAKKATKKPTRKRRSFFEPESRVLAEWLAQQNDLGVSLQLIIVDAIRNYGEGDVIQAFLTARESVTGEPQVTSSLPTPKAAEQAPEPVKAAPKAQTPSIKAEAVVPEDADELPPEPVQPKGAPVAVKPEPQPESSAEGDPLGIMFGDIESNYNG